MTAVNWNNPTESTTYTDVLDELRARDENIAKLDFSSDTNLDTGFIRWNDTDDKFQKYNGSTWDDLDFHALVAYLASDETVTGSWEFDGSVTVDEVIFDNSSFRIHADTSDGADTKNIGISSGGALSQTRGAYLQLFGNEGSSPGDAILWCGNVSGASVLVGSSGAHDVEFYRNSAIGHAIGATSGGGQAYTVTGYDLDSGLVVGKASIGGQRVTINSTTWTDLARIDLTASQCLSGVAHFAGVQSGVDAGRGQVIGFCAYKAAGSSTHNESSLYSHTFGSSALEFRITTGTNAIYFQARLSTGTTSHKASVAVDMVSTRG